MPVLTIQVPKVYERYNVYFINLFYMIILYIIFSPRIESAKKLDSLGFFGISDPREKRQIYGAKRQIYGTSPTNLRSRRFSEWKNDKITEYQLRQNYGGKERKNIGIYHT